MTEAGSNYTLETKKLTGWVTEVEGKKFTFFRPQGEEKYYLYCYDMKGKELHTWDVGLKVGGMDAVTSTEAFRKEVKASLKVDDCLVSETTWFRD